MNIKVHAENEECMKALQVVLKNKNFKWDDEGSIIPGLKLDTDYVLVDTKTKTATPVLEGYEVENMEELSGYEFLSEELPEIIDTAEYTMDDVLSVVNAANRIDDKMMVGEAMAKFLMDEDIKTYDMFEDLAYAYTNADGNSAEVFRAGMDKACRILLRKSVAEVASDVIKEVF